MCILLLLHYAMAAVDEDIHNFRPHSLTNYAWYGLHSKVNSVMAINLATPMTNKTKCSTQNHSKHNWILYDVGRSVFWVASGLKLLDGLLTCILNSYHKWLFDNTLQLKMFCIHASQIKQFMFIKTISINSIFSIVDTILDTNFGSPIEKL